MTVAEGRFYNRANHNISTEIHIYLVITYIYKVKVYISVTVCPIQYIKLVSDRLAELFSEMQAKRIGGGSRPKVRTCFGSPKNRRKKAKTYGSTNDSIH